MTRDHGNTGASGPGRVLFHPLVITLIGVGALLTLVLAVQIRSMNSAFDEVERKQVAQDADRLRIGLEGSLRRLQEYGITNSQWDGSYDVVRKPDNKVFAETFYAEANKELMDVDGVLGVDEQHRFVVGGIGTSGTYVPPPAELRDPKNLRRMVDVRGKPTTARCGIIMGAGTPYLYCGVTSGRADSTVPTPGGLVYLRTLDGAGLKALGQGTGLTLTPGEAIQGATDAAQLQGRLGTVPVRALTSQDRVQLDIALPTLDGSTLHLLTERGRPLHGRAMQIVRWSAVVLVGTGLFLVLMVILINRYTVRQAMRPVLETLDQVARDGDLSRRALTHGRSDAVNIFASRLNELLEAIELEISARLESQFQELTHMVERRLQKVEQATAHFARPENAAPEDDRRPAVGLPHQG